MIHVAMPLMLAANAPGGPPADVSICNAMALDLSAVTLEAASGPWSAPLSLRRGECARLPGLRPGIYTLRFTERSGANVAMCWRKVSVAPGAVIRVAPDDGATCAL